MSTTSPRPSPPFINGGEGENYGKVTVVEVDEIVADGLLDPDGVHVPGIYVDRIVKSTIAERRIEKLTTRPRPEEK